MFLFSTIAIPLEPVQCFWRSKKLQGITKGILLVVLFFVAVGLAPTNKVNHSEPPVDQQTQEIDKNVVDERIYVEPVTEDDLIIDNRQEPQPEEGLPADTDSATDPADNEIDPSVAEISDLKPVEIEPDSEPALEVAGVESEPEQAPEAVLINRSGDSNHIEIAVFYFLYI